MCNNTQRSIKIGTDLFNSIDEDSEEASKDNDETGEDLEKALFS